MLIKTDLYIALSFKRHEFKHFETALDETVVA